MYLDHYLVFGKVKIIVEKFLISIHSKLFARIGCGEDLKFRNNVQKKN